MRLAVTWDNAAFVLRIEALEFVHRYVADVNDLLEVQVAAYLDGVCSLRNVGFHRADVVLAVVGHDVVGRNESRYVTTCFAGQIVIDGPIVGLASCPANGLVDGARPAVVGGDDQIPIVVDAIKVLQIACCSPCGLDGVATFVYEAVAFQAVELARLKHELPKSGSTCARYGRRIQGRFDDGQVFQFERQIVGIKGFFENRHVEIAGAEHEGHLIAQAGGVHVDELAHDFIVGHLHNDRHARQAVDVDGVAEQRILMRSAAILSQVDVSLGFPVVQQAVQRIGHASGQVDGFFALGPVFVDDYVYTFLRMERGGQEGGEHQGGTYDQFLHILSISVWW